MTKTEYDAETVRIEKLISVANIGKNNAELSLAEKVAHNRERNRLQDVLVQHKLNYFELVTGESNQPSDAANWDGMDSPSHHNMYATTQR